MTCTTLHRGQGSIIVRPIVSGAPGKMIPVGWASGLDSAYERVNVEDQREDYTGNMGLLCETDEGIDGTLTITMRSWLLENLAYGLYGDVQSISPVAGGTHIAPDGLAQNDIYSVPGTIAPTISEIKDSAGTPATLVLDTDYQLQPRTPDGGVLHGGVQFIGDLSGFTQPLEFTYDDVAHDLLAMFTRQGQDIWIEWHGVNVGGNRNERVEFFRCQPQPFDALEWISKSPADLVLTARLAVDATRAADANFGPFGRVIAAPST